jgi:DNA polymerase
VAKFSRLAELADEEDNRVRGAFVFAGGSATGRASSYGAQVHNFTRKCAKQPEDVRQAMVRGHAIVPQYGKRVTDVLKGMLRPALIPAAGKSFVVADWASIEARVTPWASRSLSSVGKLDLFATGKDVYKVNASHTFNVDYEKVTDDQRQIGKVQELALGFAGGIGAFAAMGRAYGVRLPDSEAQRMVNGWRRANPWAAPYWQGLENAYTTAMRNKNTDIEVGCIVYHYDGRHLWYMLPSGRVLCYPYAKFDEDGISYAKSAWKPAQDAKHWPRARLWKGLACENITQAIANDLLRYALRQLDDVVLHVHDEIVIESDRPEDVASELKRVMTTCPSWAGGLPLAAEVKIMGRYGK